MCGDYMEKKILDSKGFDLRKYNHYIYFLKFFSEYTDNSSRICECGFDFTSKELEKLCSYIKQLIFCHDELSGDIPRILALVDCIYHILNINVLSEPVYLHGYAPYESIEIAQKKEIHLNCINHALILNAVMLAFGYFSKCIWCMPFDIANLEYHVIVTVYVESLRKWIFLDPSKNIFCTDEEKNILSPNEIRHHLVSDTFINFSTIHNNSSRFIKMSLDQYRIYLTKNMFRFGCFKESTYYQNDMSKQKTFYVLNPKNYYPTEGSYIEIRPSFKIDVQYTTNSNDFWSPPYELGNFSS